MIPSGKERVYHFRRKSPEDYAIWFGGQMGLLSEQSKAGAISRSRAIIEEAILAMLSEEEVTPKDIENSEEFPDELSYDAMTLAELRSECQRRGLPYSGTKAELALRLRRDDDGIEGETTAESEAPDEESAAEEEPETPADEAAVTEVEENANSAEQEPIAKTD
tara:strand:+ start:2124 stop:2615 length:492 start_codon:yes stop_codon:yes gene_type:complete